MANKIVIDASVKSSFFSFKELKPYKDLLYHMVLRDVTVLYKQTILGFTWAIINPAFQILVFTLIFGVLVGLKPDVEGMPYPIFSCLAIIPWTYFSNALNSAATSLITSQHILSKVYFPRIIFPLVPIVSKLVDFAISFAILIGLLFYYGYMPSINVLYIIFPLLLLLITTAGLGFWFAALSVQYRDFKFALSFTLPLLMYAAPVAFPATKLLEKLGTTYYHLYFLYPMVGVINGFRNCFAVGIAFEWSSFLISFGAAVVLLISGYRYFKKMEDFFADVV
jgi:lipopolysaccharide transport system permease protein